MTTLWKAVFNSVNFDFEAYGDSKEEAVAILYYGWAIHAKKTGAEPHYMAEYSDEIYVDQIESGRAYKDGFAITPPRESK